MLLKVHKDTVSSKSITQQVTKEKNIERRLNTEGVDESNIIKGKRR